MAKFNKCLFLEPHFRADFCHFWAKFPIEALNFIGLLGSMPFFAKCPFSKWNVISHRRCWLVAYSGLDLHVHPDFGWILHFRLISRAQQFWAHPRFQAVLRTRAHFSIWREFQPNNVHLEPQ